jgi:hypothetical protein
MSRLFSCALIFATVVVGIAGADDKHEHHHAASSPKNAAFEKLQKLAGTWVEADKDGKPTDTVASIIKVTAGGSAIQETIFPGQPHEMVSVYTVEGPDLVLTHYCVLGNQPRLKADPKSAANQIKFDFVGGANLNPKKDKHMHAATLTIVDADHITVEGTGWENGEPAKEMCGAMKLVRKK